jgi:hypothetical protein
MTTFVLNLGGVARSNCGATGPRRRADETEALRRPEAKASRLRRATGEPTLSRVETADRTYLRPVPRSELSAHPLRTRAPSTKSFPASVSGHRTRRVLSLSPFGLDLVGLVT